jgi:predicted metal-dependent phosphotriesterase family hydrolase
MCLRPVIVLFIIFLHAQCIGHEETIITVTGPMPADSVGNALPHEHVIVDFIGADSIAPGRYDPDSVFQKALPFLQDLKKVHYNTLFDCTPNYLGRDVKLLARLSKASGINIVTNTGYYGAVKHKYLPQHATEESAEQIAGRWIKEFNEGIDGTIIKPGFVKLSADQGPLSSLQKKMIQAGAIASRQTGLTVAVHSGDGNAAREEMKILTGNKVPAKSFIWVHAQNEKDSSYFIEVADKGGWVEFDGLSDENIQQYVSLLKFMKRNRLLHRTLVSHDAGYYTVGEENGGQFRRYTTLFTELVPALEKEGFTKEDIQLLISKNPAKAYSVNK